MEVIFIFTILTKAEIKFAWPVREMAFAVNPVNLGDISILLVLSINWFVVQFVLDVCNVNAPYKINVW